MVSFITSTRSRDDEQIEANQQEEQMREMAASLKSLNRPILRPETPKTSKTSSARISKAPISAKSQRGSGIVTDRGPMRPKPPAAKRAKRGFQSARRPPSLAV